MYSYHTRPLGGGLWNGPLIRGLAAATAVADRTWSLPCDFGRWRQGLGPPPINVVVLGMTSSVKTKSNSPNEVQVWK